MWEQLEYQNKHDPLHPFGLVMPPVPYDVEFPDFVPQSGPSFDPHPVFLVFPPSQVPMSNVVDGRPVFAPIPVPVMGGQSSGFQSVPFQSMNIPPVQQNPMFQVVLKPREPKIFAGRVDEDVDLWLSIVRGYLRAVAAPVPQQVAFTVTMLQDAAREWYNQWLHTRGNVEPRDLEEFAAALRHHFGNKTKEQVARAELRNIHQKMNESVRAYAARLSRWLGHLPTYDQSWAKDLFAAGLNVKIAELLLLKAPSDLQSMMIEAECIEVTVRYVQQTKTGGSAKMSTTGSESTGYRGGRRGSGRRGGGRRGGPSAGRGGQSYGRGQDFAGMVCYNCGGTGHKASMCPSAIQGQGRGRGRNNRGRSQRRGRGRQTWKCRHGSR